MGKNEGLGEDLQTEDIFPNQFGVLMKKMLAVVMSLLLTVSVAHAKKNCTTEPKEKWMTEAAFKSMVEGQGYTINKFKLSGACYEIYGKNKEGKSVEIYFNPVDGSIAKSK